MATRAFLTVEDYEKSTSNMFFWVQDITAANFASVTQDIDELKDAAAAIIRGTIKGVGFTKTYDESFAVNTDPEAQRETKWLVTYRDTTPYLDALNAIPNPGYGKIFNAEVPTADLSGTHLQPNSDHAKLDDPEIEAFVTAFEANVRSPYNYGANAPSVEVLDIQQVGRRA